MKLVIAATNAVAIPTIETLKREHSLTLVTMPDSYAGRGKALKSSEIANAFPNVLKPNDEVQLAEILHGHDLLITIGYGRILSESILSIPKLGGINLHFSLLPHWRGAAPVQRCIESGESLTGVTVFQMDKGMDTGPIWSQFEYQITESETSATLFNALARIGASAVKVALEKIQNGDIPEPQIGNPTYANKVQKNECIINWNSPAEVIIRKIRAFSYNPGVLTTFRGKILKVEEAESSAAHLPAGVLDSEGKVGTATSAIQLLSVVPSGKRRMAVKDWLNGLKPEPGERFE